MRDEFEKLLHIKCRLVSVIWIEEENTYLPISWQDNTNIADMHFINGAWYSFQEQQKKIYAIKSIAEEWINKEYTHNSDSTDIKVQQMKDCGRDIIQKINGD